jgi:hypothetical protein
VTGLVESNSGGFKFPDGTTQSTASFGTLNGLTPGKGLIGGGKSGNVTLSVDQGVVALQTDLAKEVTNRQDAESTLQTGINVRVNKSGDTMSGKLNLPTDGLTAGNNQLVLSGGKVGIGTGGPTAGLTISGNSWTTEVLELISRILQATVVSGSRLEYRA